MYDFIIVFECGGKYMCIFGKLLKYKRTIYVPTYVGRRRSRNLKKASVILLYLIILLLLCTDHFFLLIIRLLLRLGFLQMVYFNNLTMDLIDFMYINILCIFYIYINTFITHIIQMHKNICFN